MTGIPQFDERQGDGQQAADLVGREAEVDRIRAFLATARTDGGVFVTGEPGRSSSPRSVHRRWLTRWLGSPPSSQGGSQGPRGDRPQGRGTAGGARLARHEAVRRRQPKGHDASIEAAPLAALDPPRAVVWQDGYQTKVSDPSQVARRYGLDADLAAGLESIDAWTGAEVNR